MIKCEICSRKKSDFINCFFNDCPNSNTKNNKRGGKRKGAGRPKKAETKTVSFRVKVEQVEPLKALVNTYLTNLKNLKSA